MGKQGLTEIYVIGCGPSLKGFDWQLLKDKTTIAVNGSILDVPNPDFFLTADSSFALIATQNGFWGVKTQKILVMSLTHRRFGVVKPYLCLFDHHVIPRHGDGSLGFSEDEFATGQCSGFCGMQLAAILGAKKIHLLGMDFCGNKDNNYHHRYHSDPTKWNEFLLHFRTGINILKQHEIEVISHSPISRLNDLIPFEPMEIVHAQ